MSNMSTVSVALTMCIHGSSVGGLLRLVHVSAFPGARTSLCVIGTPDDWA